MYGRAGLERFKKAQSSEPFSISSNSVLKTAAPSAPKAVSHPSVQYSRAPVQPYVPHKQAGPEEAPLVVQSQQATQVGGGQSTWQPPEWAIEPRAGVYYLEVLKDGEILDRISLNQRRHIFGRQSQTCDFVLDHQSVSRQHAAVIPHKNGSIFVIDLGSAHGTFVANERLAKDTPVELEVGQSLRFAASSRTYILRKNDAALFPLPPTSPLEIKLLPPPDPSDEEAVVAYNTLLNRYGLTKDDLLSESSESGSSLGQKRDSEPSQRASKRIKKARVAFRDQVGGELVEVVGFSDGVDVETEPGPLGVKEGSLVGKYESLVQSVIIPKGKDQLSAKENTASQKGVTNKLQEVLTKIKAPPKSGMGDGLYGELFSGKVGSSWAYSTITSDGKPASVRHDVKTAGLSSGKLVNDLISYDDENDNDLFGD